MNFENHGSPLDLSKLSHLYSSIFPQERDEFLQCLIIAAPRGEQAVLELRRLLTELGGATVD